MPAWKLRKNAYHLQQFRCFHTERQPNLLMSTATIGSSIKKTKKQFEHSNYHDSEWNDAVFAGLWPLKHWECSTGNFSLIYHSTWWETGQSNNLRPTYTKSTKSVTQWKLKANRTGQYILTWSPNLLNRKPFWLSIYLYKLYMYLF